MGEGEGGGGGEGEGGGGDVGGLGGGGEGGILPAQCPEGQEGRRGQTVGPSQAVHAAVQIKHGSRR